MDHTTVGEILSSAGQQKLAELVSAFWAGLLVVPEGSTVRRVLKDTVLEPERESLQHEWDLDYLSFALCYAFGLPL